ncbi:MAG: hydroxyquinol 1,2-dioxygenase [Methylobacteriaceae bacterium]|jgi:catechol 1,2-dioxygenase|nr:hydroxyquinol 1,2-dioxygenase [Methylobacteriaceae bacterium]
MIIDNSEALTPAVLEAYGNIPDPRMRELVTALIKHLHGFVREVRLSEQEFQQAAHIVARLGQQTSDSHNEVVLMAGSLGMSTLVCLLNNGDGGATETQANMLGPFWRDDQPAVEDGGSLVRSLTAGPPLAVRVTLQDRNGAPLAGAEVDVWHSSPEGLYENQDPAQAEMNLRGRFISDPEGKFGFTSVMPAGYPIPDDGPVGELLRLAGRHKFRPAHLHFMIYKPGFKTLISQLYVGGDPNLDTDVQFGVTRALIGGFVRHEKAGADSYSLDQVFTLEPGEARRPRAPIRTKRTASAVAG